MRHWMLALALAGSATVANAASYDTGDWVLARYQGGKYWFPGVIEKMGSGKITVVYDDGDRETLSFAQVKPYDWRIGSAIECVWRKDGEWYAAKITSLADDGETLRVRYDDGTLEQTKTKRCRSTR